MEYIIESKTMEYTGKEIEALWAFKRYNVQEDSIIAFRGPMSVELSNMKDLADIEQNEPIYSDDAINFIVEHFDQPDLKTIYLRQRLLLCIIKEVIEEYSEKRLIRKGDLYYTGKLSVAIATRGLTSSKIHVGLNVTNDGTPENIKTSSLEELGINTDLKIHKLMKEICKRYTEENEKIERDIRKTLPI